MFGSIGMPELIIILVIALIIFGPRKLPELGRSLGRSIDEFKKASNELRSTLEEEIRLEERRNDAPHEPSDAAMAAAQPAPGRRRRPPTSRTGTRAGRRPVSRGELRQLRRHGPMALVPFPERQTALGARRRRRPIPDRRRRRRRRARCRSWSTSTSSGSASSRPVAAVLVGFLARLLLHSADLRLHHASRSRRCCRPAASSIYTEPSEAFFLYIKIAAIAGLLLAPPLRHARRCGCSSRPGLYRTRRSWRFPSSCSRRVFFVGGAAFSHYVVFP